MIEAFPLESHLNELKAINDFINAAEEVIQQGHVPDMTALEKRVEVLCVTLQGVPKKHQKEFLQPLKNILERLNSCEMILRKAQKKPATK